MLLVATAAPQPNVLNLHSLMICVSSSMSRNILMISPHFALPTVPTPLASSISPTFLGCWKWSITFSLYIIFIPPVFVFYPIIVLLLLLMFFMKSSYRGDMLLRYGTISFSLSTVKSMSSLVVSSLKVSLREPWATSWGTPIARSTWDGSREPDVQADPLDAQMPF